MTTYLLVSVVGSSDLLKFWKISDNISKTLQDTDILTMDG